MSAKRQTEYSMKRVYERLDSIEELLKMTIANDILNDLDSFIQEDKSEVILPENISVKLNKRDIFEGIHYEFSGKRMLHLECKANLTVQDIEDIRSHVAEEADEVIPVFCFDRINGMKRKRMLEKKISFSVKDKEIHIVI